MKRIICVLGIVVFLVGCALSFKETRIPSNQFNNAFDAALKEGKEIGYAPVYYNRQEREIQFLNKVGTNEYKIGVWFSEAPDNKNDMIVNVSGEASEDVINPFIGLETKRIINAIEGVVPKPPDPGGLEKETRVREQ